MNFSTMMNKRTPLFDAAVVVAALSFALPSVAAGEDGSIASREVSEDLVARGKYIVTVSGCNDCHTPWIMGANGPEPDMSRMLSGHPESKVMPSPPALPEGPWVVTAADTNTAWSGPWGISFTANLTPDRETGLGKWTLQTFTDTIRTGRHLGRGRPILPPMPIPMYKHFTDADLQAVFTYLQSIPAISNRVPEPIAPTGTGDD